MNRLVGFVLGYLIAVAVLTGFAIWIGGTVAPLGDEISLIIVLALVIEGIAYVFYLGWRNVIRGWKSELGRVQGRGGDTQSLPNLNRELGVTEMAVRSLKLYKQNFWTFLVPYLAYGLASGLLSVVVQWILPVQIAQTSPALTDILETPGTLLQALVLTALLSPVNALVQGIGASVAVDSLDHKTPVLNESYAAAKGKFRLLWSVSVLTAVIIDLASAALLVVIIPEIVFFVAIPIVIIEGRPTIETLKRSWQMASKRWTVVFELFLVAGGISAAPSLIIVAATGMGGPVEILMFGIYGGLVAPILICMSVVFYYSSLARLNAPSQPEPTVRALTSPQVWNCKTCGRSVVQVSKPSSSAFGGCMRAKRGWMERVGRHDWEATELPLPTNPRNFCAFCGTKLGPSDLFCKSCGCAVARPAG